MKNGITPDPDKLHPISGYDKEIYIKPAIKNPNIIVGDFSYIADSDFENHVTHHYEWNDDKLIIGKFCQIAAGNDVWIGQNAVILPGVHIGDGTIIGANSVVGSNIEPYTIVAGNPAKILRKRFDDELIRLLENFKWWDKSIEEINDLIPVLTCSNLEKVKEELKARS